MRLTALRATRVVEADQVINYCIRTCQIINNVELAPSFSSSD